MIYQLVYALLVLGVLGVVLYIVERYIPMAAPIKLVFQVVVAVIAILFVLGLFGVVPMPGRLH